MDKLNLTEDMSSRDARLKFYGAIPGKSEEEIKDLQKEFYACQEKKWEYVDAHPGIYD
jgi:hypothetical protein